MTFFRPAPGVYVACVRGDLVFLDSRRNQYCCLTRRDARSVVRLFSGGEPGEAAKDLIAELSTAGLIELCAGSGQQPVIGQVTSACSDFHEYGVPALPVTLTSILRLAAAGLEAALRFALSTPAQWFAHRRGSPGAISIARACELAAQFDLLRPLLPKTGRCLPKSMVLMAFLRRHGVHATCVFGVQTFPFEAHCWVEYQGVVLSDTLEHVRWYTPIAAL